MKDNNSSWRRKGDTMKHFARIRCASFVLLAILATAAASGSDGVRIPGTDYVRKADVIYARKHGVVLTMDVIAPPEPNGAAVIWAVSRGFYSHHRWIEGPKFAENMSVLLDRGYTVFAVVHGSAPKFTVPEYCVDLRRAIRFIRHHAKSYGVDPNRIGISGASAGGHLSLMVGAAADEGDPQAPDPVDRQSSRVQAVGCFFPGSDLVNYEKEGVNVLAMVTRLRLSAPYAFQDFDEKARVYVPITDKQRINDLLREYSPVTHVTPDDAPTLIVHGDSDGLSPLRQASGMIDKLTAAGVKAKLVVAKGKGHAWKGMWQNEMIHIADWFDTHLAAEKQ